MPTGVDPQVFEALLANLDQLNTLCNVDHNGNVEAANELEEFKSHEMIINM